MEFFEVIEKRRTVRNFTEQPVPEEKVIRILESGLKAPTYNHLREWDFILVKDPSTRLNIVKAEGIPDSVNVKELENSFLNVDVFVKDMYIDAIPKQKSMLLKAPELLVVVFRPKTKIEISRRVYDVNCLASAWCCIENILLALAAEDLYGVTYIPQKTDELKKILGVPENLEIAALIPFGYRNKSQELVPQKKVILEQKLHLNKW